MPGITELLWLLALVSVGTATISGDEQFRAISQGTLFVFCNGDTGSAMPGNACDGQSFVNSSVDVIDTSNGRVIFQIKMGCHPNDNSGAGEMYTTGFGGWADVVYMEKTGCPTSQGQLVIANDLGGYIHVFDAAQRTLIASVPAGMRPVHSYAVYPLSEYWAHPDGDGEFDVIDIDGSLTVLEHDGIQAHVDAPGHGKLLWDPELLPLGYASNVADSYVLEINMSSSPPAVTRTLQMTFNNMTCSGTHGLAYSSVNHHVYATCSAPGGSYGLAEIDPKTWSVVNFIQGFNGGQVYESKDGRYIIDIDKSGNKIHMAMPQLSGVTSTRAFPSIDCPGNPDRPAFFQYQDQHGVLHSRMFFSLTNPKTADGMGGGVSYIDTAELESDPFATQTVVTVNAGNSNARHRHIIRAGDHIVLPAQYPPTYQNTSSPNIGRSAVALVNATYPEDILFAYTNNGPSRMSWVPDSCGMMPDAPPVLEQYYTTTQMSAYILQQSADIASLQRSVSNLTQLVAYLETEVSGINHDCFDHDHDHEHRRRAIGRRDLGEPCYATKDGTSSSTGDPALSTANDSNSNSSVVIAAVVGSVVGALVVVLVVFVLFKSKSSTPSNSSSGGTQFENPVYNTAPANNGMPQTTTSGDGYLEVSGV